VGVPDEIGEIFRGLFLGVTSRPINMSNSGPAHISTTLSGLRLRDGAVLHHGRMLQLCPACKSQQEDPKTRMNASPSVRAALAAAHSSDFEANLVWCPDRATTDWTCSNWQKSKDCLKTTSYRWICQRCHKNFCEGCKQPGLLRASGRR